MKNGLRLLGAAKALLDASSADEFYLRRSISTVYYAALHNILEFAVNELEGDSLLPDIVKHQLQRSVEHSHLEALSNQLNANIEVYSQFKSQDTIRKIGKTLADLYKRRVEADYDFTLSFSLPAAQAVLASGRGIMELLDDIKAVPRDARLLAVKVLLPIKNKR